MLLTEQQHLVKGLDPVANAFAGTVTSQAVNMKNFGHCTFIVHKGVGTTGTATLTVEACSDTSGTGATAVPFRYRATTSGDTPGALTEAAAAGFTTTAGSSQLYVLEVDASVMGSLGLNYLRLKSTEVVASAVVGSILAILSEPRYAQNIFSTAIV